MLNQALRRWRQEGPLRPKLMLAAAANDRIAVMRLALCLCCALLIATPVLAQTAEQQARNALNWQIFQKLYPPRAIAAREEGDVAFTVTLDSKGDVTGCQVTKSSGHPLLDEETCKVVTINAQFSPDSDVHGSRTRTHEGLITWRLPDWAKATEASTPVVATANPTVTAQSPIVVTGVPEKVVCKKTLKVGSLADFERTCMTPTDWAKQSDEAKQWWDEVQGRKGSSGCITIGGGADHGPSTVVAGMPANGAKGCE